jgi:peptidoglycan/xylan/chitin deacetylase (PgdA/CDA1 family)
MDPPRPQRPGARARRPPVLLYHGFGWRSHEADPFGLFVPVERFEGQLRLLKRYFHPLDLGGYLAGLEEQRWPPRSVLVTIDDGYVSTLEEAAPLLARHGVPAVLFVPAGLLGQRSTWMPRMPGEPLLTAEQLLHVSTLGVEVGVHGMDHRLLAGLDPAQLRRQVVEAREVLGGILGHPPRSFAYPGGVFDERTVAAIAAGGYDVAFSVHRSVDRRDAERFTVRRRGVNRGDSALSFSARLTPCYDLARQVSALYPAIRRLAGLAAPTSGRVGT